MEPVPPKLKRLPCPLWMSPASIRLIDKISALQRNPPPQKKRGEGAHESRPSVPYGGFPKASRGGSRGVSRDFHRRIVPLWSVLHTETLVLARIPTGAQTLLDGYGKGQGGLPDPLSEGEDTPPWTFPVNTQ